MPFRRGDSSIRDSLVAYALPQIQRMIEYPEEALVELEEVTGVRTAKNRKRAQAKSA